MRMMSAWRVSLFVGLFALIASGCATTGTSSGSQTDRDVITREQINESNVTTNANSLIRQLRPHWLRVRGGASAVGEVVVYVDGMRRTSIGQDPETQLRTIQVDNIAEVRYLNPQQAIARYGTGHQHGAILVETRTY